MELIDVYRGAGLPLRDIARILASDESVLTELLAARLKLSTPTSTSSGTNRR